MKISLMIVLLLVPFKLGADLVKNETLFWYDQDRKITLWKNDYNIKHESYIYTESPSTHARKQVLTGKIIITFPIAKKSEELSDFSIRHNIFFIKKINIGSSTYLFYTESIVDSLQIANSIYREHGVIAAYPDWMYLLEELQ
ncbi:MAG: hypothetical protein L3J59_13470 [Methylococcaceae bacterium]|nr:hypothetical protein [Methylococcaceae bacterium]